MKIEEVITGLHCAAKVHKGEKPDCLHCRWAEKAKISDYPEFANILPDFTDENGEGWWVSCDGDTLMECAAVMLEAIQQRMQGSLLRAAREEYKNL